METMRPQKGEATFSGLCDFDIWRWDVDPGYLALDSIKATKNAYHLPKELTPGGGGSQILVLLNYLHHNCCSELLEH